MVTRTVIRITSSEATAAADITTSSLAAAVQPSSTTPQTIRSTKNRRRRSRRSYAIITAALKELNITARSAGNMAPKNPSAVSSDVTI